MEPAGESPAAAASAGAWWSSALHSPRSKAEKRARNSVRFGHPQGPRGPEQQKAGQEQEQFPSTGGRQGLWCIRCVGSGGIADQLEGQFKGSSELRFAEGRRAAEQSARLQEDVLGIERVKTSEGGLEPRTVQQRAGPWGDAQCENFVYVKIQNCPGRMRAAER